MKNRLLFLLMGSLWAASSLAPAATSFSTLRFSKLREKSVVELWPLSPGLVSYSSEFTAVATLTNVNTAAFDATTHFNVGLGNWTAEGVLGDDPSYIPGNTSVTITNWIYLPPDFVGTAGRITLSWVANTLAIDVQQWDAYSPDETIATWRHEATSGTFSGRVAEEAGLENRVNLDWPGGSLNAYGVVYYSGKTTLAPDLDLGINISTTEVTSGALDTTAPTIDVITFPTTTGRWSNDFINVTGRASDNKDLAAVTVWGKDGVQTPATSTNGFKNWTARISLVPGTNVISAQSQDFSGNRSVVKTARIVFVVTQPIGVQTTGSGTVSPNYHGQFLEVGRIYTMTASGVNGFALTNWTSNLLPPTNRASFSFSMQTGLVFTANFVDTNKPTLKITTPASAQRIVTNLNQWWVHGNVRDNVGVADVQVNLNNAGFQSAPLTGTNWQVLMNLVAGSNSVAAYSIDARGNKSPTYTVGFTYVVSALLTVQTNGSGTVSPNYNGLSLEIGKNYTMTASGKNGFAFTNWTSNLLPTTNRATFTFPMLSNLLLRANFVDVTKPVLRVTTPISSQRIVTNQDQWLVKGTATDNAGVTDVQVNLNGTGFQSISFAGTNWQTSMTMKPGTNTVDAYAVDAAGNKSLTDSRKFTFVVSSALTLLTNGLGTISRTFTSNSLEVGKSYTVTAVPRAGWLFSNWSGTITATNKALSFFMQSNMVLRANFVTNLFLAYKGTYNGLFFPSINQGASNSGHFSLVLSDPGTFSGKLLLAGATLPFSGGFNVAGEARVTVPRTGTTPLTMNLYYQPAERAIDGEITDGNWHADLSSDRAATNWPGAYTITLDGTADPTPSAPGLGAISATVSSLGTMTVSGTLADSTAITETTGVAADGTWPFYASFGGGRGVVIGWMGMNTRRPVLWIKPPATTGLYPNGFYELRSATTARYLPPATGRSAVNWRYGQLTLQYGDLPGDTMTSYFMVTNSAVKVWSGSLSNLTVAFTNSSGRFGGTFKDPVTGASKAFRGVLMQTPGGDTAGHGWFLGTTEGGKVHLSVSDEEWPEDWVPASLIGKSAQVHPTDGGQPFVISFGTTTFSQTGEGGMGSYIYTRLGNGLARVTTTTTLPPTRTGTATTDLRFTDFNTGSFTSYRGTSVSVGTFTVVNQPTTTPASLVGKTITAVPQGQSPVVLALTSTAFTETSGGGGAGAYTFTKYSPAGALLRLIYTAPVRQTNYVECTFAATNSGSFVNTFFQPTAGTPTRGQGNFTVAP